MNIFLIFLHTIISNSFFRKLSNPWSLKKVPQITVCSKCKYFVSGNENEFSKCSLFPIAKNKNFFMIRNRNNKEIKYNYCITTRNIENMCGKNGKMFEKKS